MKKYSVPVTIKIKEIMTVEVSNEDCLKYKKTWETAALPENVAMMKALDDARRFSYKNEDDCVGDSKSVFTIGDPWFVEEVENDIKGPKPGNEVVDKVRYMASGISGPYFPDATNLFGK